VRRRRSRTYRYPRIRGWHSAVALGCVVVVSRERHRFVTAACRVVVSVKCRLAARSRLRCSGRRDVSGVRARGTTEAEQRRHDYRR
jgi:hypothetical protein